MDVREKGQDTPSQDEENKSPGKKLSKALCQLLVSLLLGFVFGVALEKTRVFEPKSIRLQMVFERWIMLKIFLAALSSSMLSLAVLSLLPFTWEKFHHTSDAFLVCLNTKDVVTSCVGPVILGAGMTVSGACPGMVLAQVGAWAPNAIFTLLGCLVGALSYGMAAPWLDSYSRPRYRLVHKQVHTQFNKPFAFFAIPLALCIGLVVVLMEVFLDYRDDLERPEALSTNVVRTIAWPPYVGGLLIGVLQIPMALVLEDTLGGSSSYVIIVSQWVVASRLQEKFPYLAAKRHGVGNWWQVLFVGGAILGALSSAAASHSLAETQGVGVLEAFFGGILMLLGARFAAGCPSGHGISGVSLLTWLSFLVVPCMFGGGILVAIIMRAAGGSLDRLVNSTLTI